MFHSLDVWHKAKNIGKKIAEVAKYKATRFVIYQFIVMAIDSTLWVSRDSCIRWVPGSCSHTHKCLLLIGQYGIFHWEGCLKGFLTSHPRTQRMQEFLLTQGPWAGWLFWWINRMIRGIQLILSLNYFLVFGQNPSWSSRLVNVPKLDIPAYKSRVWECLHTLAQVELL